MRTNGGLHLYQHCSALWGISEAESGPVFANQDDIPHPTQNGQRNSLLALVHD